MRAGFVAEYINALELDFHVQKSFTHLLFFIALFDKFVEPVHNKAGARTVEDVDGRIAHPCLKFVDGKRNVLGVVLQRGDENT